MDKTTDSNSLPVRRTMCGTCPFRRGSKYEYLRADLELSARTDSSRICHSTGRDNAIHESTGLPEYICRGARDVQLAQFHDIGFLPEPTDAAWNEARAKIPLPPQRIEDPPPGRAKLKKRKENLFAFEERPGVWKSK